MSKDYAKITPSKKSKSSTGSTKYLGLILVFLIAVILYAFSRGVVILHSENNPTQEGTIPAEMSAQKDLPKKPRFEFYTALSKETVSVGSESGAKSEKTNTQSQSAQPVAEPGVAPSGVPALPISTPIHVNTNKAVDKEKEKEKEKTIKSLPAKTQTSTSTNNIPAKHYLLQIAALEHISDVDRLKAQLSFLGFETIVEPFQNSGKQWYRVKVGTFDSLTSAQAARKTLLQNHLAGIICARS